MKKKDKEYLKQTLYHAKRAYSFIQKDTTFVCVKSSGTTTIEYKNKDNQYITAIHKDVGSHLTGLVDVIERLELLLKEV